MYQKYNSNQSTKYKSLIGGEKIINHNLNYNSIEIPIGLRHNFFLSNKTKIFVTGSFVYDLFLNTSIKSNVINGSKLENLDASSSINYFFSLGYKYKSYSLEIKYQSKQVLATTSLTSTYNSYNLVFGYTLF
ncbi:hypothetical protein CXF68_03130 [Tenacibaculum sp. Bg11-29]|uniref:hypothetical protein n=1 Tax=Tenacibaculum sp. Bg11-29 TaxID=2058306 RepID=UPI000C33EDF4|nr:hypothetical protein [Tenacibaculum sp. Bg11-29]PKH49748.1 hypothetical protein CXF68_03130 [Tenacibaculum sp. Bg11-29]